MTDLDLVTARGRRVLLGLVGLQNAGKTTLLGAGYLAMTRSGRLGPMRFAGSYTLGGWESVAAGMRWRGPGAPPSFPPHTPRTVARAPGMLHMALRRADGGLTDLLVTDAPGEWFMRWAYERDAEDARGARWVARHADAFLLALDSEALAGPDRGEARAKVVALIQRLGAESGGRPVAAVWTKADIVVPPRIHEAVDSALARFLPGASKFAVTVAPGAARPTECSDLFAWAVAEARDSTDQARSEVRIEPRHEVVPGRVRTLDPFFAFRARPIPSAASRVAPAAVDGKST